MGSKRSKKPKNDIESLQEEPESNSKEKNSAKAHKRKKTEETDVPAKMKKANKKIKENNNSPLVKVEPNSPKQHSVNGISEQDEKSHVITWPDEDIVLLISKMEDNIPEEDNLAFKSRLEKLNWDRVAFKNYTAQECKDTWFLVQKRIRGFRLLRELLQDAKKWIETPKEKNKPPKRHPDMPRRPLSSYLLYYVDKKPEVIQQHPGLEGSDLTKLIGQIYKNLPAEEKEIYEKKAAANKEKYMRDMKLFFDKHPDLQPPRSFLNHSGESSSAPKEKVEKPKIEKPPRVEKPPKSERPRGRAPKLTTAAPSVPKERPPKKVQTPFGLYFATRLPNIPPGVESQTFKDNCKLEYKSMSDTDKLYWINLAEKDQQRYDEEVARYKETHPLFKGAKKVRPILTKKEMVAKERAKGIPVKPPNSAYALYSRLLLQSQEIKVVNPKERMNFIANKWKECPEEEKSEYRERMMKMTEKYKADFEAYLQTLPEEERKKLEPPEKDGTKTKKPKGQSVKRATPKKEKSAERTKNAKPKFTEPEQPHRSPSKYFASVYKGEGDPAKVWKSLQPEERRRYENELTEMKRQYIVEFERFLKSLSKEELEEFSKSRQQQVNSDDDDDDDDDDEDEEDDNDEESSECSSVSSNNNSDEENEDEENDGGGSDSGSE